MAILFRDGVIRSIARIIIHPEYRLTAKDVPENDLALLQFSEPLNSKPIRFVTEAQSVQLVESGDTICILGWGTATFAADSPISNNLLYAFVEVVDRAKCNAPDVYAGSSLAVSRCP